MITLSVFTSSNSISTFIATIESFFDKCENYQLINEIIHIDDRSPISNRNLYIFLLQKFFPHAKLIKIYLDEKYYNDNNDYLHNYAVICEKFREQIIHSQNKYVFMMEDDWFFCKNFDLKYFSNILEKTNYPQILMTTMVEDLNNKSFSNFIKSEYNNFYINNEERLFSITQRNCDKTFYWYEVFGYQYFSQNPNLTRIDFLRKNGPFPKRNDFELEYNKTARLNNFSYNLISGQPYAYHIGDYKKYLKAQLNEK